MTNRCPVTVSLLLLLLVLHLQLTKPILSFTPLNASTSNYHLQDVVREISVAQSWESSDLRVSRLDLRKVRFGRTPSYEFRVGLGKTQLVVKFSDEVGSWRKFRNGKSDFGSLVTEVGALGLLDTFKLEGPFELRVGGDDKLSLLLPMNTSHNGLTRILVGEGITVEVRRAQEVSLIHSSGLGFSVNRSLVIDKEKSEFWPFWHSTCIPLLPIQVLGAVSLVAYRTRNADAHIETTLISKDTIELLPEKCYNSHVYKKWTCPIDSLSSRITILEKVLSRFLRDRIRQNRSGFLKTKIKASAIIRFRLELERDVRNNDTLHSKLAEWRTKPSVERIWFEVLARVDTEKLEPLLVKKVNPFNVVDSVSWSNLMSNLSFTQLQSALVPPDALTLDVKW
ncbi:hypothetical protein FH972_018492 [Carpinus fangiana]|uniref:Uncharacterized protein n=1 Tax=Carpinus fangiana TaxID=176857 RepID=A0A5N6RMM1_9ROSI|nr:hypothetical protein FH972_018492 [Carpinus fangiana]